MEADAPRQSRAIRSMTGFGRGSALADGVEVVAEVRALNHRFLDIFLRMPRVYTVFEPHLRKVISEYAGRGKIEVSVTRRGMSGKITNVNIDLDLAERYRDCLVQLKDRLGIPGEMTLAHMLSLQDIVSPEENREEIQKEQAVLEESLRQALRALDEMRTTEGHALWKDIEARLIAVREIAAAVYPLAEQVPALVRSKLEKRIQELTGGMELNEDRLLQEVAILAEKGDVTEELTRLESHVDQFLSFGKEGSPIGRKMDFLLQEIHRELNTLGSKSTSTEIATHVVNMKSEVERIREQTQNLE